MWWEELGPADARALMMAMNEPPETAFRVNSLRADPARLVEDLRATGERIERPAGPDPLVPAEALVLKGRISASLREHLAGGELVGQARSSQGVVSVLDPRPGERVLDLCAGPGVKTTAIAARMEGQGEVVAVELNSARARQISDLAGRLGARNVRVRCADALVADLGGGYDRALVDPPCSDLGALASRPDARWRKSPELVKELRVLQRGLLERAAAALRPGGTLTYSVCTICRRESEAVVSEVLAAGGLESDQLGREYPTVADASDPRYLQSLPHRHGTDGFFIARLRAPRSEAAG